MGGGFFIVLIQKLLDLHSLSANPMGLIPVYFSEADNSVGKPDTCLTFEFSPSSFPILPLKSGQVVDSTSTGDNGNVSDSGNDLKVH